MTAGPANALPAPGQMQQHESGMFQGPLLSQGSKDSKPQAQVGGRVGEGGRKRGTLPETQDHKV